MKAVQRSRSGRAMTGFMTGLQGALAPDAVSSLSGARAEIAMAEEQAEAQQFIHRFLGGPPLAVLGRLALLSILVGVILAAIGLDPWNIIESVRALIIHIWTMGFDILRWLWRYFLLGAVIVVPIWLLVRLAKAQNKR
jgi:Family of unknown function (DUF6460)